MQRLKLIRQGRVVLRRQGGKIVVHYPNGRKQAFSTASRAQRAAMDWFRERPLGNSVGLGEIVWK